MNIIIPLGGKGERFVKEGYLQPKPLIKILNKEMIFYVLDNLELCQDDKIFIIYFSELDKYDFINIFDKIYIFETTNLHNFSFISCKAIIWASY